MTADMHTHSLQSHDSDCKLEDMYKAELAKGTEIFAVTNHIDISYAKERDIFAAISGTKEEIESVAVQEGHKILFGIELGEGFWNKELCERVLNFASYDVVLGSVHAVRYAGLDGSYSAIDFSALSDETIAKFLNTYFDDVLELVETTDFDILAHLPCPLRYINGIYQQSVSLAPYREQIKRILQKVIERGCALEVNTSTLTLLGQPMPDADILRAYYDMGGRRITIGSDAHEARHASRQFPEVLKLLKEIGFEYIYYYEQRKPIAISI